MTIVDVPATTISEASETLRERVAKALAESTYPDHCRSVLLALAELMVERGWSQAETARRIKHGRTAKSISTAALSQLLGGTYQASPEDLCRHIAISIDRERGRALYAEGKFARTRLYDAVVELADLAVLTQRIVCLHGGILCGKTTAAKALAEEYRRASVVYFAAPYADTYGAFVRRLARLRGIPLKGSLSDLREAIIASLDSSHLLVVDEFHQPVVSYGGSQALRCMEFLREINDTARCGILFIGSSTGYAVLCDDARFLRIAAGMHAVDLCDPANDLRPLAGDDLAAIARSFGLRPDETRVEKCRAIAADHTVSRLFDLLRIAAGNAEAEGRALSWSDVDGARVQALKLAA